MTEYIERGTAIAKLTALEVTAPSATMTDAKRLLADMPAADVAPVVRCKDCLYWERDMGFCHYHSRYYDGGASWDIFNEDDFCSYGERKEND